MLVSNQKQTGFTIVELLIVIVVIGILALLVLNTFTGIQQKARDTERQTDATSVAKQLEAYYAQNGAYPQWAQINSMVNARTALRGTSENAYSAPGRTSFDWVGTNTTTMPTITKDSYAYRPSSADSTVAATACTSNDACQSFIIRHWSEKDNTYKEIKSLN